MGYAILGPKCSIYYLLISVWGVVMLTLMGIFFKVRSPALFEDLPHAETEWKNHNFTLEFIQDQYDTCAINCWIAAALYACVFIFSLVQVILNSNQSSRAL